MSTTQQQERYLKLLNMLRSSSVNNTPVLPSTLSKDCKISSYAIQGAAQLGYIVATKKRGSQVIKWIGTRVPNISDADRLIAASAEFLSANNKRYREKTQEKKFASITIDNTKIRVPIVNNRIEFDVSDANIKIEIE